MVQITNKLFTDLKTVVGKNKDKITNEHTLQAYIAIAILNDEVGPENTTLDLIMEKIGKQKRRTEDILFTLVKKGLLKRTNRKIYEIIG